MNTDYQFWLIQDTTKFRFPFNPEKVQVKSPSKNSTIDIDGLGEITQFKSSGLMRFNFDSHFPKYYFEGCEYIDIPDPEDAINFIQTLKNSKLPMRFVVTNTLINYMVTIEEFNYSLEGGDVGSVYFDISLVEYRSSTPQRIDNQTNTVMADPTLTITTPQENPRQDNKPKNTTYKVISGDSLWKIAQIELGDGNRYLEIAELNGIQPKYDIYPDQIINLPT